MGIPHYFYILTQKYNNIISNKLDYIPDIYCLDFNGIIHPIAHDIIDTVEKDKIEETIILKLKEKIEKYLEIKPSKLLICIDGVAPVAKMIQQRKRRYLSVLTKKIDKIDSKWDSNAITPNTIFMNKLNKSLKSYVKKNKTIIFSGTDEDGEGEHKIYKFLKTKYKKENKLNNKKILINGLDADLIILSLISNIKNIYLIRENKEGEDIIINIDNLREAIIKELKNKWYSNTITDYYNDEAKNIIESYCVMCSLLGNDFIPHLLTLNLKNNGLDRCINYTTNSIKSYDLLVKDNEINYECLKDIILQLSKTEETDIYSETEKYLKKYNNSGNPSDFYAIKHKDPVAKKIYSDISKWRLYYYRSIFNTHIYLDTTTINIACSKYIEGIYWTYNYYKGDNYDNEWFYPYTYPPTIKDISNYMIGNLKPDIKINNDNKIDNKIQLLLVLPPDSIELLPLKYRKYMTSSKYGLLHLYPKEYKIQTYLKTYLWECSPQLPLINLELIKEIVK